MQKVHQTKIEITEHSYGTIVSEGLSKVNYTERMVHLDGKLLYRERFHQDTPLKNEFLDTFSIGLSENKRKINLKDFSKNHQNPLKTTLSPRLACKVLVVPEELLRDTHNSLLAHLASGTVCNPRSHRKHVCGTCFPQEALQESPSSNTDVVRSYFRLLYPEVFDPSEEKSER